METTIREKPFVLITGAAVRVGRELALDLMDHGYKVGIHYYHSEQAAQSLMAEIKSKGGEAILIKADLREPNSIQTIFQTIKQKKLSLSVVINSAAIMPNKNIDETSVEEWDQIFNLNLRAIWLISKFAKDLLKNNKGVIINFSDSGVNKTWINHPVYIISKSGVNKLSQILAKAYAPDVRVNVIAPGLLLKSENVPQKMWDEFVNRTPLQNEVTMSDLLQAVHFCINNKSLTGEIITLDGGYQLI